MIFDFINQSVYEMKMKKKNGLLEEFFELKLLKFFFRHHKIPFIACFNRTHSQCTPCIHTMLLSFHSKTTIVNTSMPSIINPHTFDWNSNGKYIHRHYSIRMKIIWILYWNGSDCLPITHVAIIKRQKIF